MLFFSILDDMGGRAQHRVSCDSFHLFFRMFCIAVTEYQYVKMYWILHYLVVIGTYNHIHIFSTRVANEILVVVNLRHWYRTLNTKYVQNDLEVRPRAQLVAANGRTSGGARALLSAMCVPSAHHWRSHVRARHRRRRARAPSPALCTRHGWAAHCSPRVYWRDRYFTPKSCTL